MVQLIETSSGTYIWSERYAPANGDILSVQEGIARAVVAKLQLILNFRKSTPKQARLDSGDYDGGYLRSE
jgi:hypothetical protein